MNRLQLAALKGRNTLDQGLPLGERITSIPPRPCKGLIIVDGVGLLLIGASPYPKLFSPVGAV